MIGLKAACREAVLDSLKADMMVLAFATIDEVCCRWCGSGLLYVKPQLSIAHADLRVVRPMRLHDDHM